MWTNILYYPHSDDSSLNTLNTALLALSHTQLTGYSNGTNKVVRIPVYFLQRFSLLHHVKEIEIRPVFWCSPITSCFFALYLNSIRKLFDDNRSGSRQITYSCKWMNNSITNSDIISLRTLNATLMDMLNAWLNGYSTSTNKVIGKQVDIMQWFGLLHGGKQIDTHMLFWRSPLIFSWYISMLLK